MATSSSPIRSWRSSRWIRLPVKRLIESAKGSTKLVDATNGRRTRAVIVTGSDHLILSSLEPATLAQRLVTDRGTPGD